MQVTWSIGSYEMRFSSLKRQNPDFAAPVISCTAAYANVLSVERQTMIVVTMFEDTRIHALWSLSAIWGDAPQQSVAVVIDVLSITGPIRCFDDVVELCYDGAPSALNVEYLKPADYLTVTLWLVST